MSMPTASESGNGLGAWAGIISVIKTPLGFFALVALVVEAVLAAMVLKATELQRTILIWGMLGIMAALVVIVFALAVWRPEALGFPRAVQKSNSHAHYSLVIGPSEGLHGFDITRVDWDFDQCFLIGNKYREQIRLVPVLNGRGFRVELSKGRLSELEVDRSYSCSLKDKLGNTWQVKPFYLFETAVPLLAVTPMKQLLDSYSRVFDAE